MELNEQQKNILTSFLEDQDIGIDKIEETIHMLNLVGRDLEDNSKVSSRFSDDDIKIMIKNETNPSKRLSLKALLISRQYE